MCTDPIGSLLKSFWNPYHSSTVSVNLYDLPPKTTYYYSVQSMDSSGKSDGVTSPIKTFTTQ